MPDTPRPPESTPPVTPADPARGTAPAHAHAPKGARPPEPAVEARDPDEYLETPGSHRRPDGAATDVGG